MFGASRDQLRTTIVNAWLKYRQHAALEPLEQQIAQIVRRHPEYHRMLERPGAAFEDFPVEAGQTNPFLHVAMHIAVEEQRSTDRPRGFSQLYTELLLCSADEHELQHRVMEILGQVMWAAQRESRVPDQDDYLAQLRLRLAGGSA